LTTALQLEQQKDLGLPVLKHPKAFVEESGVLCALPSIGDHLDQFKTLSLGESTNFDTQDYRRNPQQVASVGNVKQNNRTSSPDFPTLINRSPRNKYLAARRASRFLD